MPLPDEDRRILELLAHACSMYLEPSSVQQPFGTLLVSANRRTAATSDFSDADVARLAVVANGLTTPLVQARAADIVWLLEKPRRIAFAFMAIDAYMSLDNSDPETANEVCDCWRRALRLATSLGPTGAARREEVVTRISDAISTSSAAHRFIPLRLESELRNLRLGKAHAGRLASSLAALAEAFEKSEDFLTSNDYFQAAGSWHMANGADEEAMACILRQCDVITKEARARLISATPSRTETAALLEDAIQLLRSIPRRHRQRLGVEIRIASLRAEMESVRLDAHLDFGEIRLPAPDMRQHVAAACSAVRGRGRDDALRAFVQLHAPIPTKDLERQARASLTRTPFRAMMGGVHVASDGRVVARHPGTPLGDAQSPDDAAAVHAEMVMSYCMGIQLAASAYLLPALEVLRCEHRITTEDFVHFAHRSGIVDPSRLAIVGKGLGAGYDGDFLTALHLLAPQMEHFVRRHLKLTGATTTMLTDDGIETENTLRTLLGQPEAVLVFGDALVFEWHSLFCDPIGPNLRNQIAHGLLSTDECTSPFSVAAWWHWLRIVVSHALRPEAADT
jgi:hypothetical protein